MFSVFHYTTDDGNSQYKLIVAYQAFIISESYGDYKMYLWWESKFAGGKSKSKLQMFHGAASLEVFESVGHQPKTESTNPFGPSA